MVRHRIERQSAIGLEVARGSLLRIVDPDGGQVADLWAIARGDAGEWLSNGRTFDYNGTVLLTTGHVLYSNRSRAMLEIVADDVGRHDFLYAPCSREMFRRQYGVEEDHPNCLDHLARALAPHGVERDRIGVPLNVFMNVEIGVDGDLEIRAPRSRPGDALTLRAELDLVVGVAACSASLCNGGSCSAIDVELA